MESVLLFGGGLQTLSLARGLYKSDFKVFIAGEKNSVGRHSRFINGYKVFLLQNSAISDLIYYVNDKGIKAIIPSEDEFAEWLSIHRDEIEKATSAKCAIVDSVLLSKVMNKSSLLTLCKEHNIPCPKTEPIYIKDLEAVANRVGFPALIKPDISNGSRGISAVRNIDELKQKAPQIAANFGQCSLQEFINNPHHYYNAMLYRYADGTYSASVVTKITRFYPIKGGSSSFCTSIVNERIIEICKNLLDAIEWNGFADFDVLEKGDGDYRIIEINPRVPASLHAALASGVDFGHIIAADHLNLPRPQMNYTPGEQLRYLGLDIAWFLSSPNRFRCKPHWFNFFGKHLHYQDGGAADFKAMLYSLWSGVRKQLSPSFRKSKSGMN